MHARASLFGTTLLALSGFALGLASCSGGGGGGEMTTPAGAAGSGAAGTGAAGTSAPATGTAGSGAAGTSAPTTGTAGSGAAGTSAPATGAAGSGAAGASGTAGASGAAGNAGNAGAGAFTIPTVAWPSAACQTMATTLVGQMTRAEKAAQMVMAPLGIASVADVKSLAPGAVFAPGGYVPPGGSGIAAWGTYLDSYIAAGAQTTHQIPFLMGADVLHGNNTAIGTVIFPHNAGLGGSNDPALVQQIARITAMEAAAAGLNWTFAPFSGVSWDDQWGRVYESFSEDPSVANTLVAAATMGLQGAMGLGTGTPALVGCSKHWAGDGMATPGTSNKGGVVDRGNITVDEATMMKVGVGPYIGAIGAGLGSVMVSDASWNGTSLTVSSHMLTDILKGTLKFPGFVSTDWNAATESKGASIVGAINAGVDMLMQPSDWKGAITTITNATAIPDARINDAATRIIETKCQAGLFGWKRDTTLAANVGSADHRTLGRQAVSESMVLLQNTGGVLPLAKGSSVWVGGSGADSLLNQCGGWTIAWQGSGNLTTGTTIKAAISKVATIVTDMASADAVVVVLSEKPYAEFEGDSMTLNTLPAADFTTLGQAKASGKKVVAIVISGRPVLIADHLTDAGAWIAAWLPGTEGDGVADVLFGVSKPTAKLSHTWPKTDAQAQLIYTATPYDPLFAFGFGLTY
jgi:beta-glucosidase